MSPRGTRRSVLKTGAAVGGLAITGSLAGCSDLLGGGGLGYTNWLYAPGAAEQSGEGNETENGTEDEGVSHYLFSFLNYQKLRANEDNFGEGYNESEWISSYPLQQMGVDYDAVDSRIGIGFGGYRVVDGSFSQDEVVGTLEDNDFEEESGHADYTVLRSSTQTGLQKVLAIDGGTVVSARAFSHQGPRDTVEALIDAKRGVEDRYVDVNEDMDLLTDELGTGVQGVGRSQAEAEETDLASETFAGQVASGGVLEIDGDTATQTWAFVFADSDDVDTGPVEEWTETAQRFELDDEISVSASGRVVTVTAENDTATVFGGSV